MARITLDPMITELHGRIGKRDIVAFMRKNIAYTRRYVKGRNPDTPLQRGVRRTFADAVREWQAMPGEEKERFGRRARNLNMSGYNLFISGYMGDNISHIKNRGKQVNIPGMHSRKASHLLQSTSVSASLTALYGRNMPCILIQSRGGPPF